MKAADRNYHFLGASIKGRGDIRFEGCLEVDAQWIGDFIGVGDDALLIVGPHGRVQGRVQCHEVLVYGELDDVQLQSKSLRAFEGAKLRGRFRAENVLIDDGVAFEGSMSPFKESHPVGPQ